MGNVGTADRIIRAIVGVVLILLPFVAGLTGFWTWLLPLLGVIALGTAALKSCPLYSVLGINTCKR
ncbi:YgaP family membrane protein [Segnochrobactraceae bacterium EtOH-i3]